MNGPAPSEAPPPRRLARPALALALALSTLGVHASNAQQATPTTDLGVFVHQRIAAPLPPLPVAGATVCVTPDLSEPAFWGKWTRSDSPFPYSGVPGLYVMQDIPAPPGMISSTVFVTVARQGDVTAVDSAPLSSFLPTPGPTPGSFTVRFIELQSGGQSSGDCGTPPQDPLGPAVAIRIIPQNATARVGDLVTFKLEWSAYAFAAPWYLYEWVIDDPSIATPSSPSQGTELQVEALSRGTTRVTAYLLRPDGTKRQSESAWIEVEAAPPPPPPPPPPEQYTFGWERPIDQRAANDFSLPHACAVGLNLEQIVHARSPANGGCSIRMNPGEGCATCHRMNAEDPTLEGIQKNAFCDLVPRFVANPAAATNPMGTKPQNLKDFFDDWYNRRLLTPNGECPD